MIFGTTVVCWNLSFLLYLKMFHIVNKGIGLYMLCQDVQNLKKNMAAKMNISDNVRN